MSTDCRGRSQKTWTTTRRTHRYAPEWVGSARFAGGRAFLYNATRKDAPVVRNRQLGRWGALPRVRSSAARAPSALLRPSHRRFRSRRRSHHTCPPTFSDRRCEGHVTLIPVEEYLHLQHSLLDRFGCEVTVDGESLESRECEPGTSLVRRRGVERRQELSFLRAGQVNKAG